MSDENIVNEEYNVWVAQRSDVSVVSGEGATRNSFPKIKEAISLNVTAHILTSDDRRLWTNLINLYQQFFNVVVFEPLKGS